MLYLHSSSSSGSQARAPENKNCKKSEKYMHFAIANLLWPDKQLKDLWQAFKQNPTCIATWLMVGAWAKGGGNPESECPQQPEWHRDRTDFRPDKFSSIAIFFLNCTIEVSQGQDRFY